MRKRFLLLHLVTIFASINLFAKVSVHSDKEFLYYDLTVDQVTYEPVFIEHMVFMQPILKGVEEFDGIVFREGRLEIPVIRLYIDGEGEVEVKAGPPTTAPLNFPLDQVKPSIPSVLKVQGAKRQLFHTYSISEKDFAPRTKDYELQEMGVRAGVRRRLLTLYPMSWNPRLGEEKVILHFTVRAPNPEKPVAEAAKPADEMIALVVGEKFHGRGSLTNFIQHKQKMGYLVKTIAVNAQLRDPAAIRNALRTLYLDKSHTLKHVILIGDEPLVPGFRTPELKGVTDHYYRCLDTEKYEDDIATPDVSVGRFSVESEDELDSVIEKQIFYEQGAFKNEGWLKKVSLIGTDDETHWNISERDHEYVVQKFFGPKGYIGSFPSPFEYGGDKLYAHTHKAKSTDVLKRLQEARGFINYSGHGLVDEWETPQVTKADVRTLHDPDALPVVISNSCDVGMFTEDSFAETWQRHRYGSVLFWGSMDSTYWDEDEIIQKSMTSLIHGANQLQTQAFTQNALADVWRYYGGENMSRYFMETYVTFGDPSMLIRTTPVRKVSIHGPKRVSHSANRVKYTLHDQHSRPIAGARMVTEIQNTPWVGTTNAKGEVVFHFPEALPGPGKMTFWISGANLKMRSLDLELAP